MLDGGRACYNTYRAADGRHLAVGALEPKFWASLCNALGQPCDMSDPVAPPERQQQLKAALAERFATDDRDRWSERLASADACVEPVLQMEEVAAHPQHRHREMFFEIDDPERGPLSLLRLPMRPSRATAPAPRQGQHTDEVLAEAGIDESEIASLRQEGIVR